MKKSIILKNKNLIYDLKRKNVKNINLRIKPDGAITVSANSRVSQKTIDAFLMSKASLIINALEKVEKRAKEPLKQYFAEDEVKDVILALCKKTHPYFEALGIEYPVIKFRKMVSQWGNCRNDKRSLTFNTNLMYAPIECVEYVVWHEFTHFLVANHSPKFYEELFKVCPDWKERRRKLKEIRLR
jgi:predicted metal-dependent hydrolase